MTEREFAIAVVRHLHEAGHQALWAGGCVRDELLGLPPKDYDIATDARPEQVCQLFRRTVTVGMSFGVVEVIGPKVGGRHRMVQVATFRSDLGYTDGRRPDAVVFSSPQEDAQRRDFTINGMFFDPLRGRLIDYVGGQDDLRGKVLRAIGDPQQRFTEDKLRLLRAVRIAARFELAIEPATAAAIRDMASQVVVVSAERIADELRKLLTDPHRARGARLLSELRLLEAIFPELRQVEGEIRSDGNAPEDPLHAVVATIERLPAGASFSVALAALLHRIGPAPARVSSSDASTGAVIETIAERLRLANAEKDRVTWLVANQDAVCAAHTHRLSRLKRLLAAPGIRDLIELFRAKALAQGKDPADADYCEHLLRTWSKRDINPPPLVTGNDLIQLGLVPGPRFKEILNTVRDAQLDGAIGTTPEALDLVARLQADERRGP